MHTREGAITIGRCESDAATSAAPLSRVSPSGLDDVMFTVKRPPAARALEDLHVDGPTKEYPSPGLLAAASPSSPPVRR